MHLLVHDQPMSNQTDYLQKLHGSRCSDWEEPSSKTLKEAIYLLITPPTTIPFFGEAAWPNVPVMHPVNACNLLYLQF